MVDMNKSLISEIRSLREDYAKQDEAFENLKSLLGKIYELNRQQSVNPPMPLMPPPPFMPPLHGPAAGGGNFPPQTQQINQAYFLDQINQSMMNNLSFQSERTPFNANQLPPSFTNNLNNTGSNYSIPSSASGLTNMLQQQQSSSTKTANQQQQPLPPFNPQQPPPSFKPQQQQPQQLPNSIPPPTAAFKFAPSLSTTSTPQANSPFTFSNLMAPAAASSAASSTDKNAPPLAQIKPPQFDLSPNKGSPAAFGKPPTTATTTTQSGPGLFPGLFFVSFFSTHKIDNTHKNFLVILIQKKIQIKAF